MERAGGEVCEVMETDDQRGLVCCHQSQDVWAGGKNSFVVKTRGFWRGPV